MSNSVDTRLCLENDNRYFIHGWILWIVGM